MEYSEAARVCPDIGARPMIAKAPAARRKSIMCTSFRYLSGIIPNFVGSASTISKSVTLAATGNTRTGSSRHRRPATRLCDESNQPLKGGQLLRKGNQRQMLLSLNIEQIGDAAHDEAVHHECDCECGEFCGNTGIHERLLKCLLRRGLYPKQYKARAVPRGAGALKPLFLKGLFF